jgi:DNA polymerase III alpha subunit
VRDLWLRTGLSVHVIERLADADAFGSLGLTRRQALWAAKALGSVGDSEDNLPLFRGSRATRSIMPPPERGRSAAGAKRQAVGWGSIGDRDCYSLTPTRLPRPEAVVADLPLSRGGMPRRLHDICDSPATRHASPTAVPTPSPQLNGERAAAAEPAVMLPPMSTGEEVVNDYRFLQLSLRAHPASFLRPDLVCRGIVCNEDLRGRRSGERLTVSGLVTIRQRPATASGVIFMTIEDETGIANIVVWPKTFERFRPIIMGARYIAVAGELQQESGVIHVVARELDDLTPLLARLTENATPIESLARADAIKRPHDENVDSRARGRRNPPRIAAPTELPDIIASDLDVPARGSAHAPARRGAPKIVRD